MVHYVPLKSDLSYTLEILAWAERESSQAALIARSALRLGRGLGQQAALYYVASVLRTLADLPGSTFDDEVFARSKEPVDVGRSNTLEDIARTTPAALLP